MFKPTRTSRILWCVAALAGALSAAPAAATTPTAPAPGWYAGDLHTHTYLSDGRRTLSQVGNAALGTHGLQFLANTDHGGTTRKNAFGATITPIPHSTAITRYSLPSVTALRSDYPGRIVVQGFEWSVPTHDHANVGFVGAEPQPLIDFETRFDRKNTARPRTGSKLNDTHAHALAAVRWLQANHPTDSYLVINHPSRKLLFSARDLREFADAGPSVVVGLEGMPGRQRNIARGGYEFSYGSKTTQARTWGGADYTIAKVGGVWDSLLAEGRHFYAFANSDFHGPDTDFWPGQYSRTWLWLDDPTAAASLPAALRSGRSFSAHGDLIDRLEFTAVSASAAASMGETLTVEGTSTVTVTVRMRTPFVSQTGVRPYVDHVDIIASPLRPRAAAGTSDYSRSTNPSAAVVATIDHRQFSVTRSGWSTATVRLRGVSADSYLRLRGTNHPRNTPKETDAQGNPLCDTLVGDNTQAKALADLWFYSNPLWIDVSPARR